MELGALGSHGTWSLWGPMELGAFGVPWNLKPLGSHGTWSLGGPMELEAFGVPWNLEPLGPIRLRVFLWYFMGGATEADDL